MSIQKFHIGKHGPSPCYATQLTCRYGGDTTHYSSLHEAECAMRDKEIIEKDFSFYTKIKKPSFTRVDLHDYETSSYSDNSNLYYGRIMMFALYDSEGRLHAEDKPALILKDRDTNKILREEWVYHGVTHRDKKPALLTYDSYYKSLTQVYIHHGIVHDPYDKMPAEVSFNPWGTSYTHYTQGKRYREGDQPSVTVILKNGTIILHEWHNNHGEIKRDPYQGPCFISYYDHGSIKEVRYGDYDKRTRIDGPSLVLYDTNGDIIREEYTIQGSYHSALDGSHFGKPSCITYYPDGSVRTETWLRTCRNEYNTTHKKIIEKKYQPGEKQRETWTLNTPLSLKYIPVFSNKKYYNNNINNNNFNDNN